MQLIESNLLNKFDNIKFGFSTKIGLNRKGPYYFNLSFSCGDSQKLVEENREAFFNKLGIKNSSMAFQKQIHSDRIKVVDTPGNAGECDAMITKTKGLGLAISSADCAAIFIFDKYKEVIAGIHSGWRGTEKQIVNKTLRKLVESFNSQSKDLSVYISPAISQEHYEVGIDVAELFDPKYIKEFDRKLFLDVTAANYDMLINFGIPENQIEVSGLCSYSNDELLHSYRRDGIKSGRALGVISMMGNE